MAFLGGLFSAPKPPDPGQTAATQAAFNRQAQTQNMIGQQTPYGSLQYVADPSAPGGYRAVQSLSAPEQSILGLQQQGQIGAGTAAGDIGSQLAGLYGQPANLDPMAMTNQLMNWQTSAMQPYWDVQQSNLQAQLANQGLSPQDPAYQDAMRAFTQGVGGARNQFFAQAEPLAFQQAVTQRELPMQEFGGLMSFAQPQGPSFVNTPQVQPPDYQTAAQNAYNAQMQQYASKMQGLFGIPTALAGGWALGGFKGAPSMSSLVNPFFGGGSPSGFGA